MLGIAGWGRLARRVPGRRAPRGVSAPGLWRGTPGLAGPAPGLPKVQAWPRAPPGPHPALLGVLGPEWAALGDGTRPGGPLPGRRDQ